MLSRNLDGVTSVKPGCYMIARNVTQFLDVDSDDMFAEKWLSNYRLWSEFDLFSSVVTNKCDNVKMEATVG